MKIAQRLGDVAVLGLAVLLVAAAPVAAADLPIPPLLPSPTKASLSPWDRPAPPAQAAPLDSVIPNIPNKDIVKETPAEPRAIQPPEPPIMESSPGELPSTPTWLERFGPFLKSQLDMIFTGSITPPAEPRCEPGKKSSKRSTAKACGKPPPRRNRSAQRHAPPAASPPTASPPPARPSAGRAPAPMPAMSVP
jgi:hypothetical protein